MLQKVAITKLHYNFKSNKLNIYEKYEPLSQFRGKRTIPKLRVMAMGDANEKIEKRADSSASFQNTQISTRAWWARVLCEVLEPTKLEYQAGLMG